MGRRLRLFVSAGPDVTTEREVIGKTIAGLPISIGWVIIHTPARSQPSDPAMEAVALCDFHALLLATDISAPVGAEFDVARRGGKRTLAFLREGPRTPAAAVFVRQARVEWRRFRTQEELQPLLQKAILDQILERPEAYGLSVSDWETLSALSSELGELTSQQAIAESIPADGGAGGDAVIVAPGRDLPPDGALIDKSVD